MEGLVGFGDPWAVVAPILIGFGIADLSAAMIVAVLALAPPWLLMVSGRRVFRTGRQLALVGSLAHSAGQYSTSQWLGPYLSDIIGSPSSAIRQPARDRDPAKWSRRGPWVVPFGNLVAVVVAWTGPWSPLPNYNACAPRISAVSSLTGKPVSVFVELRAVRPGRRCPGQLREVFSRTFGQTWGAPAGRTADLSGLPRCSTSRHGQLNGQRLREGGHHATVGRLLGAPILLLPALNSVGAEVGKPVAPQTAGVAERRTPGRRSAVHAPQIGHVTSPFSAESPRYQ